MNLTTALSNFLHKKLPLKFSGFHIIESIQPLSGGDINDVFKVKTNNGTFVAKCNDADRYPGMFQAEDKGLRLLAKGGVKTPKTILIGEEEDYSFLLLEWIEKTTPTPEFWQTFGQSLALMHRESSPQFGLDHSNYMGSLIQQNEFCDSWGDFFVTQRLEPQLRLAYDSGFLKGLSQRWSQLMAKLEVLVPQEKPALVHGDLWGGNFICSAGQVPVLIDPAVCYAHREADISMMNLFGGFDSSVFEWYHESYPLEQGWRERIDIHNLYPLLVHVNLFGSAYEGQVASILKKFTH